MISPIDVECPSCKAAPGISCGPYRDGHHHLHHAARVEAAALRSPPPPPRVERHQELSDAEVHHLAVENLREAYRTLRNHHVTETTVLASRVKRMRRVYEVALCWRQFTTRGPDNPYEKALVDAITAAVDDEAKEASRG